MPSGSSDIYEGRDGAVLFIPSMSVAKGFDAFHVIAGLGGQIPTDGDRYGSQIFYHLYFDYQVHKHFQPFVQFSGLYYVESGDGSRRVRINNGPTIDMRTARRVLNIDSFEGVDVINLGNNGVDNNDVITWAVGAHFPISRHVTFSAGYERPLTSRKDIFKQRVTSSVRFEF